MVFLPQALSPFKTISRKNENLLEKVKFSTSSPKQALFLPISKNELGILTFSTSLELYSQIS